MISVVGPSTSVLDQQLQSMTYGFDFYQLPESAKVGLVTYTKMMFDAEATAANFAKFQTLLEATQQMGWDELLDDTDILASVSGINHLWVRRHNYDPGPTLSNYNKPFLVIYVEIDWIVPYKENVERLRELFRADREDLLQVVIAHDAEHGTETQGKYVSLEGSTSYWRFFRISPSVQVGMIDFWMKNQFIQKL